MEIPVLSFGEYADMSSVCLIKLRRAKDKLSDKDIVDLKGKIDMFSNYMYEVMLDLSDGDRKSVTDLTVRLEVVNCVLWDIMDEARHSPSESVCRNIINLNDKRVGIKNSINSIIGDIMELKF